MKTYSVNGFYGSQNTPCTVLVATETGRGSWYCVEGSENVNFTYDDVENGVDVEQINDADYFHWGKPIETLEDLEEAIEA